MFKIRGSDQIEYGPVNADVLRQWIAEGRVNSRTLVQAEGTGQWKPAADFPEFAAALRAAQPPTLPAGGPPAVPSPAEGPAETSGMAVASLVFGLLGFCTAITSLIGLPLGIVSLLKVKRSGGRLTGQGLAIAGIITSGVSLMMLPILAGMLLPALAKAKQKAQTINCVSNLKQLALGLRMYANDNQDTFPTATTWCDSIQNYVNNPRVFQCSADNFGQRATYALNVAIASKRTKAIPPNTVLLFESDGGWNVSGGFELILARHGNVVNVAFADGSVRQMSTSKLSTLRWTP
jgi:prepilin-type processing-associated H-X9-DG protein